MRAGPWSDEISVFIRDTRELSLSLPECMYQGKALSAHGEMVAICKPEGEPSTGCNQDGTLTSDFQAPES